MGGARRQAAAGDAGQGDAAQALAAQPKAEIVGDVLVGHPEDVLAGLEFQDVGPGQAVGAGRQLKFQAAENSGEKIGGAFPLPPLFFFLSILLQNVRGQFRLPSRAQRVVRCAF